MFLKFEYKFISSLFSSETGITREEKRLILEEHNYLRQSVAMGHVPGQPAAANMQEMQWDDELAQKSQQWANQCTFHHDPSRYLGKFISNHLIFDSIHFRIAFAPQKVIHI
jgi:hypothetical protein